MQSGSNNIVMTKKFSWQMFNDISPRYDFLNHFLSFGLDIHWRNCLQKFMPKTPNLVVLDVATGTADVLLSMLHSKIPIEKAYGIDMAEKMLEVGQKKIEKAGLEDRVTLMKADANQIPFNDKNFHVVTIAFGIRNMENPIYVLKEMNRTLKEGGKALILEFSLPQNTLLRVLHLFYLRNVVPALGFLFSGHYKAYRYLNQTIEEFPYGENFCALGRQIGFKAVTAHTLLGGVATIYEAQK